MKPNELAKQLNEQFGEQLQSCQVAFNEVTIEVAKEDLLAVTKTLRDDKALRFEELMDLCGVDYSTYGVGEWATEDATGSGFGRAVNRDAAVDASTSDIPQTSTHTKDRYAVVYHLLSVTHNHRLRIRTYVAEDELIIPSVTSIWCAADWYEREAFDLYGILFEGHSDLRRILTDYGFKGHPFRKDFPLIGEVEMRYDATQGRCVYEPVSIEPRVLVPRVIREDQRYANRAKAASEQAEESAKQEKDANV